MISTRRFHVTPLALALATLLPVVAQAASPAEPFTVAPAAEAAAPADAATNATQLDAINVVSQGSTRQVQRISRQDIEQLTPGSSAFKAVEKLPGVQFQSADPFGTYEWSTQVTLHGFDQSRLGHTLDGIPLGNMSYGVTNGLHITRAIISENLGSVEIAQAPAHLAQRPTPISAARCSSTRPIRRPPRVRGWYRRWAATQRGVPSCALTPAIAMGCRHICLTPMPAPTSGRVTAIKHPSRPISRRYTNGATATV